MSAEAYAVLDYGWLHDDLEDDVVGAEWHQSAIRALATSLKSFAEARGWPWHVGDQVTLIAWKPNGDEWRPAPDIVVYPRLGPQERQEIDIHEEGPPALIIEVASASTWTYDVSMERLRGRRRQAGKAYGYLVGLGVSEYLVFDPRGDYIPGQCRAWRRVGNVAREWRPEPDGQYHSAALGISFHPDKALLRVVDPEGQPVPYWFEATRRLRTLEQEVAELRAELEQLRKQSSSSGGYDQTTATR
jgi:Uma2 family endonuclease